MSNYHWARQFGELFEYACGEYESDNKDYLNGWFDEEDLDFLKSIGCNEREIFDYVEDFCSSEDEPTLETVILVTAARRDYFLVVQKGVPSTRVVDRSELPAKSAELAGIPWLPRIIAKARAKLRGEMDPDTMFGCGGDRAFCEEHDIHPADFLRAVWAAGDDDQKIIDFVKSGGKWG